jgi:hypothetical protein
MSEYEAAIKALDGREAFALAQGREDLLDVIDAERKQLQDEHDEQDAAEAGELR